MLEDFTFADAIGVVGSLTICWAYWAVSRGQLAAAAMPFQFLNLGGACLLLISLYFRPNPGAILIEVLWVVIAVSAILRIRRRRSG